MLQRRYPLCCSEDFWDEIQSSMPGYLHELMDPEQAISRKILRPGPETERATGSSFHAPQRGAAKAAKVAQRLDSVARRDCWELAKHLAGNPVQGMDRHCDTIRRANYQEGASPFLRYYFIRRRAGKGCTRGSPRRCSA